MPNAQQEETMEFCGIEGAENSPVSKAELNHFIRKVKIFHHAPMVKQVNEMHGALFDPDTGLVTIKRLIVRAAVSAVAFISGLMIVLVFLRNMGWLWF
jgi:hypothetical protein